MGGVSSPWPAAFVTAWVPGCWSFSPGPPCASSSCSSCCRLPVLQLAAAAAAAMLGWRTGEAARLRHTGRGVNCRRAYAGPAHWALGAAGVSRQTMTGACAVVEFGGGLGLGAGVCVSEYGRGRIEGKGDAETCLALRQFGCSSFWVYMTEETCRSHTNRNCYTEAIKRSRPWVDDRSSCTR